RFANRLLLRQHRKRRCGVVEEARLHRTIHDEPVDAEQQVEPEDYEEVENDQQLETDMCFFVLESLWAAGAGWADTDFIQFWRYIERLRASPLMPSFAGSLAKYRAFKADLLHSSEDGWIKSMVTVPGVPGYTGTVKVEFHHVNLATWLAGEFSNEDYIDNFVLLPREQWREGNRVFDGPHTGDVWLDHQESLPPNGRVAAIQLYSDKTRLDNRGRQAHPITACLLNIGYTQRQKSLRTTCPQTDLYFRPMKLAVYAECYRALLQPLRDWSYCGKVMADPWGRSCLVFPRFFSFVHDSPEAMDMLCVPGQELHNLDSTYEVRTETHQQAVFGRLADASLTATARSQLSQDESTQPIASGLWGWAGLPGGANRAFYPEGMHVFDLGVFLYMVRLIKPLLVRQHGAVGAGRLLAELNRRSAEVPRAHDFQIPSPGSYFTGKGV
ncbi:hypothetical protein QJQ45_026546, partial [Haematococcus lacustris]